MSAEFLKYYVLNTSDIIHNKIIRITGWGRMKHKQVAKIELLLSFMLYLSALTVENTEDHLYF